MNRHDRRTAQARKTDPAEMEHDSAAHSAQQTFRVDDKDPADIQRHIDIFRRLVSFARSRKERQEKLMACQSARKWDATKKARQVRRLATAKEEQLQGTQVLDQLEDLLRKVS